MRKKNTAYILIGLGLLSLVGSAAYQSLSDKQRKKLFGFKDKWLDVAEEGLGETSDQVKKLTDSIAEQGNQASKAMADRLEEVGEGSKAYKEQALDALEQKLEEVKALLKKG